MQFNVEQLVCYGCAHSAAGEPHPSRPSGERPCSFCVRNPDTRQRVATGEALHVAVWYDRSKPVSVPMDCYHSIDMKRQLEQWTAPNPNFFDEPLGVLMEVRRELATVEEFMRAASALRKLEKP